MTFSLTSSFTKGFTCTTLNCRKSKWSLDYRKKEWTVPLRAVLLDCQVFVPEAFENWTQKVKYEHLQGVHWFLRKIKFTATAAEFCLPSFMNFLFMLILDVSKRAFDIISRACFLHIQGIGFVDMHQVRFEILKVCERPFAYFASITLWWPVGHQKNKDWKILSRTKLCLQSRIMKEAHNVLQNVYGSVKIMRAIYANLKNQKYD